MKGIAVLLVVGCAQAALLSKVEDKYAAQDAQDEALEAGEDLMIKMPDAVAPETVKPKASLSLVQAQTSTQLGMFESGVLHSSLKPIVKAKVNKVVNFIKSTKDEYEHGTADQKKAIQAKAESLIMMGAGTRSFNLELCQELWSESTDMAGYLSFYYCPSLIFPPNDLAGTPPYRVVANEGPSRLRSGYLTQYFWNAMLSNGKNEVIDMLAGDVCYYWGNVPGICGKGQVSKTLPYIGFPEDSSLSNPVQWHCDTTTCIAPVKAWAKHENFCLTTFGAGGKVTEAIIPLSLWR